MGNREGKREIGVIIGPMIMVASVSVTVYGLVTVHLGRVSRDWQRAQATITRSGVVKRTSTSGSGSSRRTTTRYHVEATYTYRVGRHVHVWSRYAYGASSWHSASTRAKAERWRQNYLPGQALTVFYDPERPSQAVVVRGATYSAYFIALFPPLFLGVGLLFLLLARAASRASQGGQHAVSNSRSFVIAALATVAFYAVCGLALLVI
ncbi:MAG: DUF3592 domain-containing protein [Myxococcales bacterium]|nr:DUF3592 domain-containing protein [Myxococcales bacterium]